MDRSGDLLNQKIDSQLCPVDTKETSAVDCEELISLDVLSFKHEQCTCQNCFCHQSQLSQNTTADRCTMHDPSVQQGVPLSSGGCSLPGSYFSRLWSPPVFGVHTGNFTTANKECREMCSAAHSCIPKTLHSGKIFGTETPSEVDFRSIVQSQSDAAHTRLPASTVQSFSMPSFQNSSRQQVAVRSTASDKCMNLSDLHSVLEDTVYESSASGEEHTSSQSASCIHPCSCAQQAAKLDDWTVDELSGYFDNFCHIPKKMSAMAEMMYM